MLEVALEAIASPEALQLINSIHGDRVNRKSLRKPRTTKPKVNHAPKGPSKNEDKVLSILEKAKANQINITNKEENQINNSDIKPKYIIHSLKDLFNILEI